MNKNNENNFAFIATVNLGILLIYFFSRDMQDYAYSQDAFVIVVQVVANLILAIISGTVETGNAQRNEIKETDILDDVDMPQKNRHYSRSKSFLLSALLVLLIGFGLCALTN